MQPAQDRTVRAPDGAASPPVSIDQLCINTMRTLAMDAVQKAKSGHPGTPMALAPVGYTLWQQLLRYDPADPNWPNRDRFVLSVGHASMLLYSLILLAGVKSVNEGRGPQPALTLDDIKQFRQLEQQDAGPPGIPLHLGRRDHHRAARPGLRQLGRHGDGAALAGRALQQAGLPVFDYRIYALSRRRRHDGGRLQRGRLDRRAPPAVEPDLDLRQQPDHHRGLDRARLQRGHRHAVRGLRLERRRRAGCQRPGSLRARFEEARAGGIDRSRR